ncbi:MAG: thermonuclease family protein [Chloroflexota bacterium]|nr:thermonuclease family protein [Chloroflexota bacterium]
MKRILFIFLIGLSLACNSEPDPILEVDFPQDLKTEKNRSYLVQYEVIRVIDGDTVELKNGERLRYSDIDTPETVHPSKPVECFGPEASAKNEELVEGEIILVELGNPKKDRYGRILGYVYVDELFVNAELVRGGYAEVNSYGNPGSKIDELMDIEKKAKLKSAGLWKVCYK